MAYRYCNQFDMSLAGTALSYAIPDTAVYETMPTLTPAIQNVTGYDEVGGAWVQWYIFLSHQIILGGDGPGLATDFLEIQLLNDATGARLWYWAAQPIYGQPYPLNLLKGGWFSMGQITSYFTNAEVRLKLQYRYVSNATWWPAPPAQLFYSAMVEARSMP